jgi:hypothetical protein
LLVGIAAALTLAVALAAPGGAHEGAHGGTRSVESRQFIAQPPLVIPAAAFSVLGPAPSPSEYLFVSSGGYIRGGYVCVSAPVYLPQNARIRRVEASLYDGEARASARLYLYRVSNFAGSTTEMAYLRTPLDTAGMQIVVDRTINAPRVRYPEYAYYVFACLDSTNTRLYSVRIHYDVEVYLPAIMRSGH